MVLVIENVDDFDSEAFGCALARYVAEQSGQEISCDEVEVSVEYVDAAPADAEVDVVIPPTTPLLPAPANATANATAPPPAPPSAAQAADGRQLEVKTEIIAEGSGGDAAAEVISSAGEAGLSSALNVTVLEVASIQVTLQVAPRAHLQLTSCWPPAPRLPCLTTLTSATQVITLADFQRFATLGEYPGILAYILVINGLYLFLMMDTCCFAWCIRARNRRRHLSWVEARHVTRTLEDAWPRTPAPLTALRSHYHRRATSPSSTISSRSSSSTRSTSSTSRAGATSRRRAARTRAAGGGSGGRSGCSTSRSS